MSCSDTSNPSRSYNTCREACRCCQRFFDHQENLSHPKQPLVGGENQPIPTALLLIPITVYATSSGQTQIFMPQNIHEICVREKTEASSFSSSQLTGYYSILQTHLFLSPFFKYGHMNPICKIFDH